MSIIISALAGLVDPQKSPLLQDLESAFEQIESLVIDIKNRNIMLAMSNLEQAAYYIIKGVIEYETGLSPPPVPAPAKE
jgi:hypothetical protein